MIEIKGVSKQFKNETAIHYGDLVFETGKKYMLLGASGCGKSTLLNMIAGILSPDTGEILMDGTAMNQKSQQEKDRFRIDRIGYIFQDFKLLEDMTVADNIELLRLEHVDVSQMDALLKSLDIYSQKNKKVRNLSGGQKQRVAIVRALVKKPEIILADEPTGNLNYEIGRQVVEELCRASEGKTLIAVTHDERLAAYFDVVLDMNQVTSQKGGDAAC